MNVNKRNSPRYNGDVKIKKLEKFNILLSISTEKSYTEITKAHTNIESCFPETKQNIKTWDNIVRDKER